MKSAAIGACLALFVAAAAWAQAPVGTISGTVRDQSDAVVPGASVTIRHSGDRCRAPPDVRRGRHVLGAVARRRRATP